MIAMYNEKKTMGEEGFVLVVALVILVVLSVLGIAGLNNTDIEMQISASDKVEKQVFYGTESGCMRGGQWLRNLQLQPLDDYADDDLIAAYVGANDFTKGMDVRDITEDEESNLGDSLYPVKYVYGIGEAENDSGSRLSCEPIPGNNPNILHCYYEVACSSIAMSGGNRELDVRIAKPTDFN